MEIVAFMNLTVPVSFLACEQKRDADNCRREYEAEFTEAVSGCLSAEAIAACVVGGRAAPRARNPYISVKWAKLQSRCRTTRWSPA